MKLKDLNEVKGGQEQVIVFFLFKDVLKSSTSGEKECGTF